MALMEMRSAAKVQNLCNYLKIKNIKLMVVIWSEILHYFYFWYDFVSQETDRRFLFVKLSAQGKGKSKVFRV